MYKGVFSVVPYFPRVVCQIAELVMRHTPRRISHRVRRGGAHFSLSGIKLLCVFYLLVELLKNMNHWYYLAKIRQYRLPTLTAEISRVIPA